MLTNNLFRTFLITSLVFCTGFIIVRAQAPDPELVRLRNEWAMRYLEPGPHMELAKYFRAKGNAIQAFYILETARRYRFDQKEFDAAYLKHFGGFAPLDNSKAEEDKYIALVQASPKDIKLLTHLADIYVSRSEYSRAIPYFDRVLAIDPQNYTAVSALAEVYRRLDNVDRAKKMLEGYEARFPESAGGYRLRIGQIIQSDRVKAQTLVNEALKKYPEDGTFWYDQAWLSRWENRFDDAEKQFVKAAELEKNAEYIQAGAAGFFRVERKDNKRALPYYLNTYFLDPHAHFDGFAEAKVAGLNSDIAKKIVEEWSAAGKKLEDLTSDPNPIVVAYALAKLSEKWDQSKSELFLRMMRHDDVLVRWNSMLLLIERDGNNLDPNIEELLKDEDLRVRGLAAYMAVKLWGVKSFPAVKTMLAEKAQVLRFDAVSALIMYGGPAGKTIVDKHRLKEPEKALRDVIDAAGKKKDY